MGRRIMSTAIRTNCRENDDVRSIGLPFYHRSSSYHSSPKSQKNVTADSVSAKGRQLHGHITEGSCQSSVTLTNMNLSMQAKCGKVADVRAAFDKIKERNVVTWTLMICEYTKYGPTDEAFRLFCRMEQQGVIPNKVTFLCLLRACGCAGSMKKGRHIHIYIITNSMEADVNLGNVLVDMYAKCGSMDDAQQVFDGMIERTVVSWNTLIAGYAGHGNFEKSFELITKMEFQGVEYDIVTFLSILKACASSRFLKQGRQIHANIVENELELNTVVGNAIIDMYAKSERLDDARYVFDHMSDRCLVSWNTMIGGYAQIGHGEEALMLYNKLELERMSPGKMTFLSVLKACANLAALEQGRLIDTMIRKHGLESDVVISGSLIDMYTKCGSMEEAWQVFGKMSHRNLVACNTMIAGHALHGQAEEAIQLFWQMRSEGINLDHVTFVGLLSACSHAGLLDEGRCYFNSISPCHNIQTTVEHYACMVDVLSRAGCLDEAVSLIENMPLKPSGVIWRALLGACRVCSDLSLAKYSAESILRLEPKNDAVFVLLSNIYAAVGSRKFKPTAL